MRRSSLFVVGLASVLTAAVAAVATTEWHRVERFESVCRVVRKNVVETDGAGATTQLDLELEWTPCPGDQVQIVRGGKTLAACLASVGVGDYVSVKVSHFWDTRGYWEWDIDEVNGCARRIEVDSPGSFEKSQECRDTFAHGRKTGFSCNRRPFEALIAVCPWMARD